MKLKNKVALVTGASRGIGRATVLALAKEGCNVVVNYNSSEEKAKEVAEEIKKIGKEALLVKADVSDETQVKSMIKETIDNFGRIDILVNNAGIVFDDPVFERPIEQWKRTMDVNLLGVFLCSKYTTEHMLKQGNGKIINVSSTSGLSEFSPDVMDYDASKAGVNVLTKDLAKKLAPTIQVNGVAPGWVDTEMNKDLSNEFIEEKIKNICLGRVANPEEIASVIVFLASDNASYITGSIIKVDGGLV